MKTTSSLLLTLGLSLSFLGLNARAGAVDGGGGNAIRCDDGKLYSWDFINAQFDQMPVDPSLLEMKTTKEILQALEKRIARVSPPMAKSFADFQKFNADPFATSTSRIWIAGTNPLVNLGDEDRVRIPKNCVSQATNSFSLYQAVIRRKPKKIIYAYDSNIVKELEQNSPVQLSFLYVHEWLRDYTQSASQITLIDQVLHSTRWLKQTSESFREMLEGFGVKAPRLPLLVAGAYEDSTIAKRGLKIVQIVRNEDWSFSMHFGRKMSADDGTLIKAGSQAHFILSSTENDDIAGRTENYEGEVVVTDGNGHTSKRTLIFRVTQDRGDYPGFFVRQFPLYIVAGSRGYPITQLRLID